MSDVTELDETLVEAMADELVAHGEFSSIVGNNHRNAQTAARALLRLPALQAYLSARHPVEAGEVVAVPKSALEWLFGEGPDADGAWFGMTEDAVQPLPVLNGAKPRYWWRTHFRKLIEEPRP